MREEFREDAKAALVLLLLWLDHMEEVLSDMWVSQAAEVVHAKPCRPTSDGVVPGWCPVPDEQPINFVNASGKEE